MHYSITAAYPAQFLVWLRVSEHRGAKRKFCPHFWSLSNFNFQNSSWSFILKFRSVEWNLRGLVPGFVVPSDKCFISIPGATVRSPPAHSDGSGGACRAEEQIRPKVTAFSTPECKDGPTVPTSPSQTASRMDFFFRLCKNQAVSRIPSYPTELMAGALSWLQAWAKLGASFLTS